MERQGIVKAVQASGTFTFGGRLRWRSVGIAHLFLEIARFVCDLFDRLVHPGFFLVVADRIHGEFSVVNSDCRLRFRSSGCIPARNIELLAVSFEQLHFICSNIHNLAQWLLRLLNFAIL